MPEISCVNEVVETTVNKLLLRFSKKAALIVKSSPHQ